MVKNLPTNTEDTRDVDLIPGSGRSPEEMAIHARIVAGKIPGTEEHCGLSP